MRFLTVNEYAKERKITRQRVLKMISENRTLPGIARYTRRGKIWILYPIKNKK